MKRCIVILMVVGLSCVAVLGAAGCGNANRSGVNLTAVVWAARQTCFTRASDENGFQKMLLTPLVSGAAVIIDLEEPLADIAPESGGDVSSFLVALLRA